MLTFIQILVRSYFNQRAILKKWIFKHEIDLI